MSEAARISRNQKETLKVHLNVPSYCEVIRPLLVSSKPEVTVLLPNSLASFQEFFLVEFSLSSCLSPGYRKMFASILLPPGLASCSGTSGLTWSFTCIVPIPQLQCVHLVICHLSFLFWNCSVSLMSSSQRPVSWLTPDVVKGRCGSGVIPLGTAGRWDVLCPNLHTRVGHQLLVSQQKLVDAASLQTGLFALIDDLLSCCIKPLVLNSICVVRHETSSLQGLWHSPHPGTANPYRCSDKQCIY